MADKDFILDISDSQSGNDPLQFQDIAHDDHSEEPPGAKVQTHTFTNFPDPAEEEEEDDSQQANLLQGEKKQVSFWTFEYYQSYFDVDTQQVLRRILGSIVPNPRSNYLEQHIRPNPDLYGPFWICITLVFTTAIAGNMANYFQLSGKDYRWQYDFHKVTFAATAIFGYWWLLPTMLYALLWWRGSQSNYLFSEILCVYGYSLAIYIPISILWVIQISWLQWLLVMLGMAFSGSVLVLTFWPALKQEDKKDPTQKKIAFLALGLIIVFHGLLAIGFVFYFFHVPAATVIPGITTAATLVSNATTPAAVAAGGALVPGKPAGLVDQGNLQKQGIDAAAQKLVADVDKPAADAAATQKPKTQPPADTQNQLSKDATTPALKKEPSQGVAPPQKEPVMPPDN